MTTATTIIISLYTPSLYFLLLLLLLQFSKASSSPLPVIPWASPVVVVLGHLTSPPLVPLSHHDSPLLLLPLLGEG